MFSAGAGQILRVYYRVMYFGGLGHNQHYWLSLL